MGQVNVTINHQNYSLSCRDGEEARLEELAGLVDEKARDLAGRLGQVGDARLMLMVALLFADELHDLRGQGAVKEREQTALKLLNEANQSIEGIVARLAGA